MMTATYGTENICRLEMAAMRCEEIAMRIGASGGSGEERSELARAIGDVGAGWDESFAGAALRFETGDVSAYERGIDMIYYACGEGPEWFYEAQRDCYATMLSTLFGLSRAEVLVDVERVRACHATVDLIESRWP